MNRMKTLKSNKYILGSLACASIPMGFAAYSYNTFDLDQQVANFSKFFSRFPQELFSTNLFLSQKLHVHQRKKLFTKEMINDILKFENDNRINCGTNQGYDTIKGTSWNTTYLSTSGLVENQRKAMIRLLKDACYEADIQEGWGILTDHKLCAGHDSKNNCSCGGLYEKYDINIRVVELHRVGKGGGLVDIRHVDRDSSVTIDVMLSSIEEFEGGEFQTLESDNTLLNYTFEEGDALIFPSHKFHCVQPVTRGLRKVLVMELWRGPSRHCAHRCLTSFGSCSHTIDS